MAHGPKFTLLSHNKIILIFEHPVLSESRNDRTLSPVKICMHQENVQVLSKKKNMFRLSFLVPGVQTHQHFNHLLQLVLALKNANVISKAFLTFYS